MEDQSMACESSESGSFAGMISTTGDQVIIQTRVQDGLPGVLLSCEGEMLQHIGCALTGAELTMRYVCVLLQML